jgi:hypothetical protein
MTVREPAVLLIYVASGISGNCETAVQDIVHGREMTAVL